MIYTYLYIFILSFNFGLNFHIHCGHKISSCNNETIYRHYYRGIFTSYRRFSILHIHKFSDLNLEKNTAFSLMWQNPTIKSYKKHTVLKLRKGYGPYFDSKKIFSFSSCLFCLEIRGERVEISSVHDRYAYLF